MATYSMEVWDIYSIYRTNVPAINPDAPVEYDLLDKIEKYLSSQITTGMPELLVRICAQYVESRDSYTRGQGDTDGGILGQISARVSAFFRTGFANLWSGFWANVSTFVSNTVKKATEATQKAEKDFLENIINGYVNSGWLSRESADYLVALFGGLGTGTAFTSVLVIIGFFITIIFQGSGILMGDFVKTLNSKFTPGQLDPATLIRALHLAPELKESINKKLRENGLADDDIKLAKIASYQTYDVGMIMTCFLRKIITQDQAVNRLEELGFTPERIKEIMQTWEIIPSPQDLIWMVGKEAFEQDQQTKYGLNSEFPEAQSEWLTKQGLSRFWQEKFWVAHWDFPSEGRVLDLLHKDIIKKEELDAYYRLIEIPQFWREKLVQASYNPYTRVDLRRMHDMGLVSEAQVKKNFKEEGYDDEHAENMTKFYLKYNELNDKDLSRNQIEDAYENDLITRKQAFDQLVKFQYSEDQANFILDIVDYKELIKIQKLRIKSIAKMFKGKLYAEGKTRSMLSALGVELKWIDVYITQWTEESLHEEKLPDKSELIQWFSNGQIDQNTFTEYLQKMGYSDKTILLYIGINKPQ